MSVLQTNPSSKKTWSTRWNDLAPSRRKQIVTFGTIAGLVVFAYVLINVQSPSTANTAGVQPTNALLPTDEARDLGVNGVSMDVRTQQAHERDLEGEVGRLKAQLDRYTQANGESQSTKDQKVQASIDALRTQVDQMKATTPVDLTRPAGEAGSSSNVSQPAPPPPPPAIGPIRTIGQEDHTNTTGTDPATSSTTASTTASTTRPSAIAPATNQFYLPSGSFVQAVLLTGAEAPTGQAAQRDPLPVLARIKHDAILPNFYSADIRECFVLLDAIGDLASERAMMRSENISCVLKNKSVIDVPIEGFAVGEDGKAGLRGRVVSKQGMVLRKAMLAGFADGVSKAFGAASQGQLPTSLPGQQVNYGQSLQSGAMGGASSALDRIAQYYLELANELHPVIEVESGRQITLVVIRGRTLATVDPNAPPPTTNGSSSIGMNGRGSRSP